MIGIGDECLTVEQANRGDLRGQYGVADTNQMNSPMQRADYLCNTKAIFL